MGPIFKRIFSRGIELRLETKLEELLGNAGRVTGIIVSNFGRRYAIEARHGVILAAGGFEWNQALRDRFFAVPGLTRHSSTPEDANRGEALLAGLEIGAATEHTEAGWWIPTMHMPMPRVSNFEEIHQAAFDVGRPHSVCVNRNGVRFVDEACGYDDFGKAMVEDHLKTGANMPCWLVFDASFRAKFTAGGFMPTVAMPDRKIPPDWWDHYIFKADSVEALAVTIKVPVDALKRTVANINVYARNGEDPEFGRGGNAYDRFLAIRSTSQTPRSARSRPRRSMRSPSTTAIWARKVDSRRTLVHACSIPRGTRSRISMRPATIRAAHSATAIPAPAGPSARR